MIQLITLIITETQRNAKNCHHTISNCIKCSECSEMFPI